MSKLGSNLGYVDDLYEQYRRDPLSVSEAWREFFADYVSPASTAAPEIGERPAESESGSPAPAPPPAPTAAAGPGPGPTEPPDQPPRTSSGRLSS